MSLTLAYRMLSRSQWYLLTSVRLTGLLVLIVVIGNRVEWSTLPSWAQTTIGALIVTVGTMLGNSWAISYSTYVKDHQDQS
jgi:energy-converting hydrogenase Eha subunit B